MPEISVLMSVFNGEEFIKETIHSILNQTFTDFEVVIVNDGSTDATEDAIKSFNDNRIEYYKLESNQGIASALNFGLKKCRGRYIAKVDADDIYDPTILLKQKTFLDKNPETTLVKTLIEYFPSNEIVRKSNRYTYRKLIKEPRYNMVTAKEDIAEKLHWYCCITHSTVMLRADVYKQIGYQDNFIVFEDYKLFYDLNKAHYKMGTVAEKLVKVRVSQSSITANTHNDRFNYFVYLIKEAEIQKLLSDPKSNLYLWGAGSFGLSVQEVLREHNIGIAGFIDSDITKQNEMLGGKTVFSPSILKDNNIDKVIVTSQPGMFKIVSSLEELGYFHLRDYLVFR